MSDEITLATAPAATGVAATPGFSPPENTVSAFLQRMAGTSEDASAETDTAESTPAETAESRETSPAEPKEAKLPDVKSLQTLAKDGKYKEVLEALGIEVDGTKLPSDRFAKFRKLQKEEKAKLETRAAQIADKEAKVNQQIQTVLKDYEGLAKAKRAWDEGDIVGAIEAAFGEDLESISDRALKQKLAADPELHKLKRKLEAKEKAEQEAQQAAQQAAARRVQAQQEAAYIETLSQTLQATDDPLIAKASKKPDFVRAVFNAQMHTYKTEGLELSADEAAAEVMKTIREAHLSWSEVFGPSTSVSSASTDETGKQSLITSQVGKSPEKQRAPKGVSQVRAAAATPDKPDSALTEEELLNKYKKIWARESAQARMNG